MLEIFTLYAAFLAWLAFAAKRLMTYLHALQQDDYDNARLYKWMAAHAVFDKKLTLAIAFIGFFYFFGAAYDAGAPDPMGISAAFLILIGMAKNIALAAAFAFIAWTEKDPRKQSKKKLVLTTRAKRIYGVAFILAIVFGLWGASYDNPWMWILIIQSIPFLLMLANYSLQPVETSVQKKYWDEAHKKLLTLNPKVIGITGSFGKTSVKHILGHILKMNAPTLITPGSVNTPMGITRIIREQLDETHRYFVAEMGAYGPGSIKRLCDLAPPDMGIITALGHAHYERFKSLDTVAEAKFELAEAALAKHGKIILHDSCLRVPHARKVAEAHEADFILCGAESTNALRVEQVDQTTNGLTVRINWRGAPYVLNLPLFGAHHGHNAALAFAAAATLGMDPENIVTALKSTPQITHRLEVKKQPDGGALIDDAFNSNPEGFRAALDVLNIMPGRKILITPGMVELGAAHAEEHLKIGQQAGRICDVVLIVMPERIPTFIEGFKSTGPAKTLVEVASFKEASAWLDANRKPGDCVLLENDLPDIYERVPKI